MGICKGFCEYSGKKVILATGYDTDSFTTRQFGIKTVSCNIVINSFQSLVGWHNGALIRDYADSYNYYRTTMDNRIIGGGQDIPLEQNINNEKAAKKAYDVILQNIKRVYPMHLKLKWNMIIVVHLHLHKIISGL